MSPRGNSVRQHTIERRGTVFLCFIIFVVLSLIVGSVGYGIHQKRQRADSEAALQASLEDIERLALLEEDMREIRETAGQIQQAMGILGQGGDSSEVASLSEVGEGAAAALDADFGDDTGPGGLELADIVKQEILQLYGDVRKRRKQLDGYPSILPVKLEKENGERHAFWYSSGFGRRLHPFTKKNEFHRGLDIKTQAGVPVIAAANGTVVKVGRNGYLGKTVEIRHESHLYKTLYAHLQGYAEGLEVGQQVTRGQVIGYVGNTGRSTGAHLHYGIYDMQKKTWVNPIKYIFDQ